MPTPASGRIDLGEGNPRRSAGGHPESGRGDAVEAPGVEAGKVRPCGALGISASAGRQHAGRLGRDGD
eukprot:4700936-Pyramimonas_sp.AAC.1